MSVCEIFLHCFFYFAERTILHLLTLLSNYFTFSFLLTLQFLHFVTFVYTY